MVSAPVVKQHLNGLTGLRFWAAALVMFYHYTSYLGPLPILSEITSFGNSGVTFFFVLSGFVLAWTYFGDRVQKRVFYWRRFARIWPLHILTTIISIGAFTLVNHRIGDNIDVETLWPAFFLLHAWSSDFSVIQGGSGASWSLSAEAFFYAIFPLLLVLHSGIRSRIVILAVPVMCTLLAIAVWLFLPADGIGDHAQATLVRYFPPIRATQFVAGVALGVAARRGWLPKVSLPLALSVIVAFFTAMFVWGEFFVGDVLSNWHPRVPAQLFSIIPFGLLIVSVAQTDIEGKKNIFTGKIHELLGQASFALYLIHVPVALVWTYLFGKPESLGSTIIVWIAVSVAANVAAILLYKFFERPVEKWLRPMVPNRAKADSTWRVSRIA